MAFFARIAYSLLTAYILTFFSEWMFWSGRPPADNYLLDAIPSWLMYGFATFLFLMAARRFRVQTIWAVFLAGAFYGFLIEGVIAQTFYNDFPLNLSWTGLAWHALVSVVFGWWWLPSRLRAGKAIIPCLLFGLALGLWSTGWWGEPDVAVAAPEWVALYNAVFGLLLIPAYVLWDRFDLTAFRPSRVEIVGALILLLIYFAFVTFPSQPSALIFLPLTGYWLAMLFIALGKNRQRMAQLPVKTDTITFKKALPLLLIPLVASLVYALALATGLGLPTREVVYIITMPLGFVMLVVSLYKNLRPL
jgi:hypothetical protein